MQVEDTQEHLLLQCGHWDNNIRNRRTRILSKINKIILKTTGNYFKPIAWFEPDRGPPIFFLNKKVTFLDYDPYHGILGIITEDLIQQVSLTFPEIEETKIISCLQKCAAKLLNNAVKILLERTRLLKNANII